MADFPVKVWKDAPAGWKIGDPIPPGATPTDALGFQDLEQRIRDMGRTKLDATALNVQSVSPNYVVGVPIVADAGLANVVTIVAKDANAIQIGAPLNPGASRLPLVFIFQNGTGGTIANPSWDPVFALGGTFAAPANNSLRSIVFDYVPSLGKWVQRGAPSADIAYTPGTTTGPGSDTFAAQILALAGLRGFYRMAATSGTLSAEPNLAAGFDTFDGSYGGSFLLNQPSLLGTGEVDRSARGTANATWISFGDTPYDFVGGDFYVGCIVKLVQGVDETGYRTVLARVNGVSGAADTLGYYMKLVASGDARGVNNVIFGLMTAASATPYEIVTTLDPVPYGKPTMLAMERQGTTLRALKNGVSVGTVTVAGSVTSFSAQLRSALNGYLDEVFVGSGNLGVTKHLALYNASLIVNVPADPAAPVTGAPIVTTSVVTTFGTNTASLAGTVNPNGLATTYQFEYATNTAFTGSTLVPVPAATAGSGSTATPAAFSLSGLTASTLYYWRLVATNSSGTTTSGTGQFTTAAVPTPTDPPKNVTVIDTATASPKLQFDQVASVTNYVVATSNAAEGVAGRTTRYDYVAGTVSGGTVTIPVTKFDPTSGAAQTTYYGVRADVANAQWGWPAGRTASGEVSVAFPADTTTPPATGGAPVSTLRVGYVTVSTGSDVQIAKTYGAEICRSHDLVFTDNPTSSSTDVYQWVTNIWSQGMEPMLLAAFPNSAFPSDAQCAILGKWAAAFGPGGTVTRALGIPDSIAVQTIEFGNEQSYSYSPKSQTWQSGGTYANKFVIAANAIAAANSRVGLSCEAMVTNNGQWIAQMKAAQPTMYTKVKSWIVHPYGPNSRRDPIFQSTSDALAAVGWPRPSNARPYNVSEWGISTNNNAATMSANYGYGLNMTYADVAAEVKVALPDMFSKWPIGPFTYYKIRDDAGALSDREAHFGIVTTSGAAKGAIPTSIAGVYTTAKNNRV